jgi:probable phosphoglycerate mutase
LETLEIWLVRHGETAASRDGVLAGWADLPLTELGREQARAVAPALAGEPFHGVWSSDLDRAVTTARLAWGEPRTDARLREINFGTLEGQPWQTLAPEYKQAFIAFDGFHPPGGESLDEVRERVFAFLAVLPAGRHLLFTHGGVIRLLCRIAGRDGFQPTGTVVGLDWSARRFLFERACPVPSPTAFTE